MLDLIEPSEFAQDTVREMQNKTNWKLPTANPFLTKDIKLAETIGAALDFYMGGHESLLLPDGVIKVTSRGYYHYIGA